MKPIAWLKELPPEDGNGMMMTTIEEVAKDWEEPVIPLCKCDAIDKSAAIRIATALGWEPKRTWVGLTDEEHKKIVGSDRYTNLLKEVVEIVEAKLKEKNT